MNDEKPSSSRRNFIKKSVVGLAGAAVLPEMLKGEQPSSPQKPTATETAKKKKLIYRTLGKTGLKLPVVSMGVMNADNPNLVKAALDSGLLLLDTAWIYQGGRNEEMIGKAVKGRPRDSFYVQTKVFEPMDKTTGLYPPDAKADSFLEKFETSLKRLEMDHVDILLLHNAARKEAALFEPYLNALIKLKKEGKTRFIGVSTHRNEPEVIRAAIESKVYDVVLTTYNFKQDNIQEVKLAIDEAAKAGLGVIAMKTQAGVYWDGKEKKFPINMKAALKWSLQNENIHTAIPGFTTFDQLELDLSVMENLALTAQENADLTPPAELKTLSGLFCQQCGNCKKGCPSNLDIPTLMRCYMYVYGYKNLEHARVTLDAMNISESSPVDCHRCTTCKAQCKMGFDIKDRILDIIRLKEVPKDFFA